jgi:hypothetical protein
MFVSEAVAYIMAGFVVLRLFTFVKSSLTFTKFHQILKYFVELCTKLKDVC